jgi:hypothetical protein
MSAMLCRFGNALDAGDLIPGDDMLLCVMPAAGELS